MTKEMIISSSAHETRVAILEEDQVAVDQNAAADEGFDWRTRQLLRSASAR